MKKNRVEQRKLPTVKWKSNWSSMKLWENENLCKLDWILSSVILLILFVSCVQGDIRLTGNRSFLLYGHFTDFYKASYEQSGGYYANYLPSTFIAYAVWNLPLYLTGHVPEAILTNSFVNIMWYKLLPVLLYYATGHFLYKIGIEVGFGEKKSRLCKFAFLVFPVAVFSQFIFSQYDIFTVFFMVLGLYFYLKDDMWKFAFLFGFATTFKYQAVLYYLVLVVLKEKKIRSWIKYTVVMALPVLVEVLPNIGSVYFRRNVLGFGALKFVQKAFSIGFFDGINLVAAAAAFILLWAYQRRTRDGEDLFSWAMFFSVSMSFAIFGMASWNPQWLLIMVPFLVLNIMMNENGNMMVMITNIFVLALYIFSSQTMVGENVLNCGIFKYFLPSQEFAVRMWDVYTFHDEKLLCTAMWVVLLAYVVFGHPRYHNRKGTIISSGLIWQIRSAFLFGVLAYVVPLGICAAAMFQGQIVFSDTSLRNLEQNNIIEIDENSTVSQEIIADGKELSKIKIRVWNGEQSISDQIFVRIKEKDTGKVVYEGTKETEEFKNNSALYSFVNGSVEVQEGKTYELEFTSEAKDGEGIGLYCVSTDSDQELLAETEERADFGNCQLQMKVTGVK